MVILCIFHCHLYYSSGASFWNHTFPIYACFTRGEILRWQQLYSRLYKIHCCYLELFLEFFASKMQTVIPTQGYCLQPSVTRSSFPVHNSYHFFIYKSNLMHKLQTHLKVWSFTTPTCFGTSVPSSGSSYIKYKTC